jgi:glycosyltransferase involved in cell wall biosynthesis
MLRTGLRIARDQRPDAVVIEFPWPALHGGWIARGLGVPLILDAHNVEADRFRASGRRSAPFIALFERATTRLATRVLAVSEHDRSRFIQRGVPASKLDVVPNGVDPEVVRPDERTRERVRAELGITPARRTLLFFGQLDYAPNREALAHIERELLPRLDARGDAYQFLIAGKGTFSSSHPRVHVLGRLERVHPLIQAADAVVVPVTSGGGTRLKVLESIACGAPVVSTSAGAEGIDRTVCGDLLTIVDSWDGFAGACLAPAPAGAGNVPAGFLDMYSWATIVRRMNVESWKRTSR